MKSYLSGLRKGITSLVLFAMIAGPLATIPTTAFAADTAATYPSSVVNDSSIGTQSWSNPTRISSLDGSTSDSGNLSTGQPVSNYLKASGFDFSVIPDAAAINGITVTVTRKGSSASVKDHTLILNSPSVGTTTSKADTSTVWTTSMASITYGGPSDLWGKAWTPSDIKSTNFKLLFAAQHKGSGGSGQAKVDSISVTVTYTVTGDITAPVISEVTPVPTPGTDNTPDYTFTTDEAGTIVYGGSCSSATTAAAVGNNTVTFSPLADGTYTNCTIAVQDAATNTSNTLSIPSFTVDANGPVPTITSTASNSTSLSPIPFQVDFNESVADFDATDVMVVNGTLGNFNAVSGTTYTFEVTPTTDGDVTAQVSGGVAHDAIGNGNTSGDKTITYDTTGPGVTITAPAMNAYFATEDISFEFAFDPDTASSTCSVDGQDFDPCMTSPLDVTGIGEGAQTFEITVNDALGNERTASVNFTVDITAPEVDTIAFAANPTNASTSPVTVTWNEDVTDFDASDITLSAGTVDAFSGSGTTYTFTIINPVEGDVTVDIGTSTAKDLAGNDNVLEASADVTFDFTAPTLDITDGPTDGSTVQPADAAFVFSTDGTGVTCSIDGGAFGACDTSTTHDMSGLGDGAHSFTVRATDDAGNETTSATISFTIDGTAPTLAEVTAVLPFPTDDTTPDYVFSTDEEGAVTVGGSCVAGAMTALVGNNTITFDASSGGTFSDCTVTVTDAVGNVSAPLAVTPFDVNRPSSGGGGGHSSNNNNSDDAGEVLGDSIDAVGTLFNNIFGGAKNPAAPQEGETALDDANGTTTPSALSDEEEPAGLGNQAANVWSSLGGAFQGWNLWIILLLLLIGGWFGYQKFLKKS